jgi:hypothetical protein
MAFGVDKVGEAYGKDGMMIYQEIVNHLHHLISICFNIAAGEASILENEISTA